MGRVQLVTLRAVGMLAAATHATVYGMIIYSNFKVHVIHQLTHKYQVDIRHLHNWDGALG